MLVLVAGPSGAGKDALLDAARAAYSGDPAIVFPLRIVTREALAGAEDHGSLSLAAFKRMESAGGFALSWRAHGLAYGVPAAIRGDLESGRAVAVNVSRGTILAAEAMGYPVTVLHVTAAPEILAQRIAQRGRETASEIAARVARDVPLAAHKARIIEVRNETTLEAGIAAFLDALRTARHLSPAGV